MAVIQRCVLSDSGLDKERFHLEEDLYQIRQTKRNMERRNFLATTEIALVVPLVGCLSTATDGNESGHSDDDGTDTETGMHHLYLVNLDDKPQRVELEVVRRGDDESVLKDTYDIPAKRGGEFRGIAVWRETYEVTVSLESGLSETFDWHTESCQSPEEAVAEAAELSDGSRNCSTRIEQGADGLSFVTDSCDEIIAGTEVPTGPAEQFEVEEGLRVDEPPYDIERPDPPDDPEDQNEWNEKYLGEYMATDPSLDFESLSVRSGVLHDRGLTDIDGEGYWVKVLTSEAYRDEVLTLDAADEETRSRLEGVDFDESVLVAVESGYGSGSIEHRWARVEDATNGLHLHGYYTDPYEQTDAITTWVSILEVERPDDDISLARVSLTVSQDRRIHFNSTEGGVTLDE